MFQGLLQGIMHPQLPIDRAESVYEWETKVRDYEQQSGDKVSEPIKMAVLSSSLVGPQLRSHLSLQAARLATYDAMRKEAVDYLRSQQVLQQAGGQMPMDLNPLDKGKGKGKGKKGKQNGKGKNRDSKCYYCGKPGHNKGDC